MSPDEVRCGGYCQSQYHMVVMALPLKTIYHYDIVGCFGGYEASQIGVD